MSTFLLAWNPKLWSWYEDEIDEIAEMIRAGSDVEERWSCGLSKKIREGDRVFVIRLGIEPRGIFASGIVTQAPQMGPHWDDARAEAGEEALFIVFRYDVLLNPEMGKDNIIPREFLKNDPRVSNMHWDTQMSGIQIPDDVATELERIWSESLGKDAFTYPEELDDGLTYFEGTKTRVSVNSYERNTYARQKCIEHHGAKCAACGFDFEAAYGPVGKGYIHVHHLVPLSQIQQSYQVDPIKDLIPVCPNCHAMIHRYKKPFGVENIQQLLGKYKAQ